MFIIKEEIDETIEWPVTVETPVSGGKNRKYEFTGTFKRLNEDQKKALKEVEEIDTSGEWKDDYVDRTMQIMTNWSGVVNVQKEPIPYTRENLLKAIKTPSGSAIITGIYRAMNQIEAGVKAKN